MLHNLLLDVIANKTIFDKDVLDGVYCTTAGIFSKYNTPLCFVGGNCSLQVNIEITLYNFRDLM